MSEEAVEALWDQAKGRGMTYEKMVNLLESQFKLTTIQGLIKRGEGSPRLIKAVRTALVSFLKPAESVEHGFDRLVDRADIVTLEQWKHRAIFLEDRLKQLQANMRSALQLSEVPIPKVSSGKRLSEDQAILKREGDKHSDPPPPPGKK